MGNYYYDWKNVQGHYCRVIIDKKGDSSAWVEIQAGTNPFILKEYNTEEDFYKPVRGLQANLEIVSTGVTVEDFLGLEDDTFKVTMSMNIDGTPISTAGNNGNTIVYNGYLSQDDFQEEWTDNTHIIKLVATDGLGLLNEVEWKDDTGAVIEGAVTIEQAILYATLKTSFGWTKRYILNSLFNEDHDATDISFNNSPLEQTYIDARSFEQAPTRFDDCFTVLDKINRAFNQTIFQYKGQLMIARIAEFLYPEDLNVIFEDALAFPATRTNVQKRYDINVSDTDEVKLIAPFSLSTSNKPSLYDKSLFKYVVFDEVVFNESFALGTLISSVSGTSKYTLTGWDEYTGTMASNSLVGSPTSYRKEVLDANFNITDSGVVIPSHASLDVFIRSFSIPVKDKNQLRLSIHVGIKDIATVTANYNIYFACIQFDGGGSNKYTLAQSAYGATNETQSGKWTLSGSGWGGTNNYLSAVLRPDDNAQTNEKVDYEILSNGVPMDGTITINLVCKKVTPDVQETYIRDLKVDILGDSTGQKVYTITTGSATTGQSGGRDIGRPVSTTVFTKYSKANRFISGEYSSYTKSIEAKKRNDQEIFRSDSPYYFQKGCLLQPDTTSLTKKSWANKRDLTFPGERFITMNARAQWLLNYRFRERIYADMFGIVSGDDIITLLNTIKFPDDAPTKTYAVLNLNEMDFKKCTWNATLLDIIDTDKDTDYTDYPTFEHKYLYGNQ